jgi:hypothetical protein
VARRVKAPLFPRTPGEWLACFRYRTASEDGQPLSPESLAPRLAVSGDTIRRWEAGLSRPGRDDLQRATDILHLKPVEALFLTEAFEERCPEAAPEARTFVSHARQVLSGEFPGYMYDSLFYVRAWNSYTDILRLPRTNPPMGDHLVETALAQLPPDHAGLGGNRDERQSRVLREFWLTTANLCGTSAYREVLGRLSENPEFVERWMDIALGDVTMDGPIITPYYVRRRDIGEYRVVTSRIVIPPVFYLREYIPLNAQAQVRLEERRKKGPAIVSFRTQAHWAS